MEEERFQVEQLEQLRKATNASKRKLALLKLEREVISRDVRRLRRVQRELVNSVRTSNDVYLALREEIQGMVEFIPFTEAEREKIQSAFEKTP
uniref:Uncharacterized protein n=1 Tax=viral metagenome TaxID=1070528 RepID=A0A6C0BLN3_9ZZZZ